MASLWDHEEPVLSHGIDIPRWIDPDIDCATVAAIVQGGCASGAYMPAVTYYQALATMNEHGDSVVDYIGDAGTDKTFTLDPEDLSGQYTCSWGALACDILSYAVELWAMTVADELEQLLEEA